MISSIVLLLVFCIIYMFIIEIFTVLFRLTGLSEEKARFQVISLLTACGFTTSQSEVITLSRKRRKLASITIIFGYIFSLIVVSAVVNIFLNMSKSEVNSIVGMSATLLLIFTVIFSLWKLRIAKLHFDQLIHKVHNRLSQKKGTQVYIVDVYKGKVMANVHVSHVPASLQGKTLENSGLKQNYGIQVLIVSRHDQIIDNLSKDTILEVNDDIVVFGTEKEIRRLFHDHKKLHIQR